MSDPRATKAAALLRSHAALLAGAGALALLAGGLLASEAHAGIEREASERLLSRWSEEASFAYRVPVTRNGTLWSVGTVLPMGAPGYFRTVSDTVEIDFAWRLAEPERATGLAHAEMTLLVREEAPDGRAYWEIATPLAEAAAFEPAAGVRLSGTIDLDAVADEVAATRALLPTKASRVTWEVEATVRLAAAFDGTVLRNSSLFRFPILVDDPLYVLPPPEALRWTSVHPTVEVVVAERRGGWPAVAGATEALALLAGGVLAVAGAAWARATDPHRGLPAAEIERRRLHDRHAAWITETAGPLEIERTRGPLVEVSSLDALVQVAIDGQTRVLSDRAGGAYYVLLAGACYRHSPGGMLPPRAARPRKPRAKGPRAQASKP